MRPSLAKITAGAVRFGHWIAHAVQWLNSVAGHASHLVQLGLLVAAFLTFKYAIVPTWKIDVLEIEAAKQQKLVVDLNMEADKARKARDEMRAEVARVTQSRDQVEARRADAEKKVDAAARELSALQAKLAQTQQRLTARERDLTATERALSAKEEALAEAAYESVRRDALVRIIDELDNECAYAVAGQSDVRNLQTCLNSAAQSAAGMKDLSELDRRLVIAWVSASGIRAADTIAVEQKQAQTVGASSIVADIVGESDIAEVVVTARPRRALEAEYSDTAARRDIDQAVRRRDVKALLNAIEAQRALEEARRPAEEARRAEEVSRCLVSNEVQMLIGRTVTRHSEVQKAINTVYWNLLQRTDPSLPAPGRRPKPPTIRLQ